MKSPICIPEKQWFSTREVAELLGVSTTCVINYSRESGLSGELVRRRRGDFVFNYYQVERLADFALAYEAD